MSVENYRSYNAETVLCITNLCIILHKINLHSKQSSARLCTMRLYNIHYVVSVVQTYNHAVTHVPELNSAQNIMPIGTNNIFLPSRHYNRNTCHKSLYHGLLPF